ncbi:hypothetical protein ABZU76_50205 [Amycolatopsis sp. NPDC005232]|uniref:AMP-binding enzyme n=1 Tax=Amycolatopsis sp. NPDC005232 TaxID=3157027 RepID=UPI0033AA7DDB
MVPKSPGLESEDVLEYARQHLPKFMAPAQVRVADALPQTPTGKIQRAELRRTLADELGR